MWLWHGDLPSLSHFFSQRKAMVLICHQLMSELTQASVLLREVLEPWAVVMLSPDLEA